MSTPIRASRDRVWAALSVPAEIVRWRPGSMEPVDAGDAYPETGQRMRWRCQVRGLPVILHETPLDVHPGERLRSRLAFGLFRYEKTFVLASAAEKAEETGLAIKIAAPNEMPSVGGNLDRFAVRRFATEMASTHLQAVRDWCEGTTSSAPPLPVLPFEPAFLTAAAR